jgi:hypothetical protein
MGVAVVAQMPACLGQPPMCDSAACPGVRAQAQVQQPRPCMPLMTLLLLLLLLLRPGQLPVADQQSLYLQAQY